MNNSISKYLILENQIRVYVLKGNQIKEKILEMKLNDNETKYLQQALNITALMSALNENRFRNSLKFSSKNRINYISTESFFDKTITGNIQIMKKDSFKQGQLQTITAANVQFGGSHTSYSTLNHSDLYKCIQEYYLKSEQVLTGFIPFNDDIVVLIQPLPFTKRRLAKEVIRTINDLKNDLSINPEKIDQYLFKLFNDCTYLETIDITYQCHCNKDAFLGIIFSLSNEEINEIIEKKDSLEIICPMCKKKYAYTYQDIKNYIN